ncbi:MAG: hypothetical protein KGK33_12700 [Hyphomicrobiales bacterium]|nr:hypothetical protein [Hyphomicrobiales bacterium]
MIALAIAPRKIRTTAALAAAANAGGVGICRFVVTSIIGNYIVFSNMLIHRKIFRITAFVRRTKRVDFSPMRG